MTKQGSERFLHKSFKSSQIPKRELITNPQPFYLYRPKQLKKALKKDKLIQKQIDQAKKEGMGIRPFGYFFKITLDKTL